MSFFAFKLQIQRKNETLSKVSFIYVFSIYSKVENILFYYSKKGKYLPESSLLRSSFVILEPWPLITGSPSRISVFWSERWMEFGSSAQGATSCFRKFLWSVRISSRLPPWPLELCCWRPTGNTRWESNCSTVGHGKGCPWTAVWCPSL